MAILCFLLLGLAVMDAETLRLPDAFTVPGLILGVLYSGLLPALTPVAHIFAALHAIVWALLAALILLLISGTYYLVRRRQGLGTGDIKLLAMIGAWLGPALTLLTFVLAAFATALFAVIVLAASPRKRDALAARLPFGSFLCGAALYSIFLGAPLVVWYLHFFR